MHCPLLRGDWEQKVTPALRDVLVHKHREKEAKHFTSLPVNFSIDKEDGRVRLLSPSQPFKGEEIII